MDEEEEGKRRGAERRGNEEGWEEGKGGESIEGRREEGGQIVNRCLYPSNPLIQ